PTLHGFCDAASCGRPRRRYAGARRSGDHVARGAGSSGTHLLPAWGHVMTANFDESRVDVSRAEDEANGRSSADGKGQQVRLRIDDRGMKTQYANAFRSNATHDELMLDFGINTAAAGGSDRQPREVRF